MTAQQKTERQSRCFAVFGDLHGHLRLMFQLCRLWQVQERIHLDGILICGDLGFFPDLTCIDKATHLYAKRDPEELGFARFFASPCPREEDQRLCSTIFGDPEDFHTVRCPVVFCHGNHEDFQALAQVAEKGAFVPVDVFGRINYLRSGEVAELAGLRIAALGGAPELPGKPECPIVGPRVSPKGACRLRTQSFDVLLSHCAPWEVIPKLGSHEVSAVIRSCRPAYNFYGHYSFAIPPKTVGRTQCIWHEGVAFQRVNRQFIGPIQPGCMGILRWKSPDEHDYSLVDRPWFRAVTAHTWQYFP